MSKNTPLLRHMHLAGKRPQDVGNHLGLSRAAVSNWTTGRQRVPPYYVPALAAFLGLTIGKLERILKATTETSP